MIMIITVIAIITNMIIMMMITMLWSIVEHILQCTAVLAFQCPPEPPLMVSVALICNDDHYHYPDDCYDDCCDNCYENSSDH